MGEEGQHAHTYSNMQSEIESSLLRNPILDRGGRGPVEYISSSLYTPYHREQYTKARIL
jgi:hypothetical protein